MQAKQGRLSRRLVLKLLAGCGGTAALGSTFPSWAAMFQDFTQQLPSFTGPSANPYWSSVGPYVTYPQKAPLVLLTDRPVQLETPRHYFLNAFTPNSAFFVRWHLDELPTAIDLSAWRLQVEGNVEEPLTLSLADLVHDFKPVSIAAVNQCAGNSRSRFQPRVPGGQWGNGAMGNAMWSGARLQDLLRAAGVKKGSTVAQFEGMDQGKGPEGLGSRKFLKSLELSDPILGDTLIAYAMNGEPLPMLNGFPTRVVVPGYFATYWVKSLTWIRVLDRTDENFWMKPAYRIPDTPRGTTTPEDVKAGKVNMIPVTRMPVRSFLITPDGSTKTPVGMGVVLRGIAFSGYARVSKVEVSADGGRTWQEARLGEDHGPYAFRTWESAWTPARAGRYLLAVRATDAKGNVQRDEEVWNPAGYLWNKIERQEIIVGNAG